MASRPNALRVVVVLLTAAVMWFAGAAPGNAHSRLVSTDPGDGSVLTSSPSAVSFTFDEPLLPGMNTISINDENGQAVVSSRVTPDGEVLSLPLDAPLPDGTYQAAYRVVSADGHAVMGAITFTVAAGASSTASAAASASALPSTSASTTATTPASTSAPAPLPSTGGAVWVLWAGIAILAAAIVAAVAIVVRRGR